MMNNGFNFTETLESGNGRLLETLTLTQEGKVKYNSFFAGMSNGKLYHFNEPQSKCKRFWKKQLFYFKPEKGAYINVDCRLNEYGDIYVYDNLACGTAALRYQRNHNHRINQVMHNGLLQHLNKSKKGRCESCGIKSDRTHWAHLIEGKSLPVAELCMPCHRIYDLQGENVFVDKVK